FKSFLICLVYSAMLNLGVSMTVYTTIFTQGIAFIYGLTFVLKNKLAPFQFPRKPKLKEVILILNLGIPSGLQMAVISAGAAAIMGVVAKFGSQIVGGYGAAQRLDNIIMLPAQSLGASVNSMAGQNISIGQWRRVSRITKYGLLYNLMIMSIIGVIIFIFAKYLTMMFVQDAEAVN